MRREQQLGLFLKIVNDARVGLAPTLLSSLAESFGVTLPKIQYAVRKLKKAGIVSTTWGAVEKKDEVVYTIESLARALGYVSNEKPAEMMKCTICSEFKRKMGNEVWLKKTCPDCAKLDLDAPPVKMTTRKCRTCSKFLPETRYFECFTCKPSLDTINEDWLYDDLDDTDIDEYFYTSLEEAGTNPFLSMNNGRLSHKQKKQISEIIGDYDAPYKSMETVEKLDKIWNSRREKGVDNELHQRDEIEAGSDYSDSES